MGASNGAHIMTLVNSIIGVSILAMPFCFKQCGILLATLILIFCNLMTRLSCHYLLKSAIMTRRRSYELLAFHALGGSGKTAVELSIISLMIGTCIAFFVVMGDLGPAIIGPLLRVEYSATLRPAVLIGIAVIVVLPLGLLRNVDSLSSICTASFLFYLLLVMKVFIESMDNLFFSPWTDEVHFWRPAGILQCLPIFSMALSCQTQLLEIFESVQNGTLDKMNSIVKSAVNLCTALYMSVGFLGYIAYYKTSFTGNLLMSFSPSQFSEFIKLGFVLSVAVTFPMVIFPCRTSLHSFLFKKVHTPHYELVSGGSNHIPEAQFKCITFFIVTLSLISGLLAPNIEIVLGLLGSTIGVIICILCPPFIFMWISNKATTEKVLARAMCVFGLFIMVMGTYANLYLSDSTTNAEPAQNWQNENVKILKVPVDVPVVQQLKEKKIANIVKKDEVKAPPNLNVNELPKLREQKADVKEILVPVANNKEDENQRIEPPIPQDPEARKVPVKQKEESLRDSKEKLGNKKIASDEKVKRRVSREQAKVTNTSNSVKTPEEKIDTALKSEKRIEKTDSRKVAEKPLELKPEAAAVNLNEAQKLVEEQPPLPLLMKAQNDPKFEERQDPLLGKPKSVDREKRDLDYVTNLTETDAVKNLEKEAVGSNSFVRKVAEDKSVKHVCKKEKKVSDDVKSEKLAQPSIRQSLDLDGPLLSGVQELANMSTKSKNDDVRPPAEEKKTEERTEEQKRAAITSPLKRTLVETEKEGEAAKQKPSIIISPSKLTDPDLLLHDKLYVDEKKPLMMEVGKSMSRELKTIEKEPGSRKK